MKIVVFESDTVNCFYPLSLTKPLWELRCGLYSFRERIQLFAEKQFPSSEVIFLTRDYLAPLYRELYPDTLINEFSRVNGQDILFINAVSLPDAVKGIPEHGTAFMRGDQPVMARCGSDTVDFSGPVPVLANPEIAKKDLDSDDFVIAGYIWDLVHENGKRITDDISLSGMKSAEELTDVTITGPVTQFYAGKGVVLEPFVSINTTEGPVYIGDNCELNPFTSIRGPAAIGAGSRLLGAKIREGTTIGSGCRVGGEIEESIFHGNSNKYHDGFIGHSYIGEWVNMGALTTNSDLKNNYTQVKVFVPEKRVSTGSLKVGCFMGDFVKTGIGTLINTGTSIGTGAMMVHNGPVTPYHIPPFHWLMNSSVNCCNWLDEFFRASAHMMSRRNREFSENYREMLGKLFHLTGNQKRCT